MRRASTTTNNQELHLAQSHCESLSFVPDTPPFFEIPQMFTVAVSLFSRSFRISLCCSGAGALRKREQATEFRNRNFKIRCCQRRPTDQTTATNNHDLDERFGSLICIGLPCTSELSVVKGRDGRGDASDGAEPRKSAIAASPSSSDASDRCNCCCCVLLVGGDASGGLLDEECCCWRANDAGVAVAAAVGGNGLANGFTLKPRGLDC